MSLHKHRFLCYLLLRAVSHFPQQYCICRKHWGSSPLVLSVGGTHVVGAFLPTTAGQASLLSCAKCDGQPAAGQEGPVCCWEVCTPGQGEQLPSAITKDATSQQHIDPLWRYAALGAGKSSELLGNSSCELIQTLLFVWYANSEALHHQKRFLNHFFFVKCCKEAVLYNSQDYGIYYKLEGNWLGYAGTVEKYLQVTHLELCLHGRLFQCY